MSLDELIEIVDRHGLVVDVQRLTAGRETGGFREFEFLDPAGRRDRLERAAQDIRRAWTPHVSFVQVRHTAADHQQAGRPYLYVTSFWCDRCYPENPSPVPVSPS